MHQCTYPLTPLHLRTYISALSSTNPRTSRLTSAHLCTLSYRGNTAFLPYEQIVAPMLSERLYGGIGEKSIGFSEKVYRVFSESL